MAEQAQDSLLRYNHTRENLAAIDRQVQALDVQRQTSYGATLSIPDLGNAAELLRTLATAAGSFATAAGRLAESLDEDARTR